MSTIGQANDSYGIYNKGEGSIIISGGTMSTSISNAHGDIGYGIYNNSMGRVIVERREYK